MEFLLFNFFLLSFLGLTGAGQETIQLLNLYDPTYQPVFMSDHHYHHSLAIVVNVEHLGGVSSSVLMAESWLKTHVLAHFPSTKISTILVSNPISCPHDQNQNLALILPSLKNLYHSLTRWGLQSDIKLSVAFSSHCFSSDFGDKFKPLLQFLVSVNSTCTINLPSSFTHLSDESLSFVSSKLEKLRKIASLEVTKINVVVNNQNQYLPRSRKLEKPFPDGPNQSPEQPPVHFSGGFPAPATIVKNPQPPQPFARPPLSSYPHISPPPFIFPFSPEQPPSAGPGPYGYLPPCNPADTAEPPAPAVVTELWCVAKPSVPTETLQEALDYACGDGGADCSAIMPAGNCYYPDTVVAHASYAFNSYFQKNKRNGGSCSFGDTAMIVSTDPSFLHCKFLLS